MARDNSREVLIEAFGEEWYDQHVQAAAKKLRQAAQIWTTQEAGNVSKVLRRIAEKLGPEARPRFTERAQAADIYGIMAAFLNTRRAMLDEFWDFAKRVEATAGDEVLESSLSLGDADLPSESVVTRREIQATIPRPRRQRRPITDPELLERRRRALEKARAVRAAGLATKREQVATAELEAVSA